jgi:hypothetical protein
MKTLIYKRTHTGDPDPESGVWLDCMGTVKSWQFDAVIGVGGDGPEPRVKGLAGKVTFIGLGPHRSGDPRKHQITFDHFWCPDKKGPILKSMAPVLARRLSRTGRGTLKHPLTDTGRRGLSSEEVSAIDSEVKSILELAENAGASSLDEVSERGFSGSRDIGGQHPRCGLSRRPSTPISLGGRDHGLRPRSC